MSPDCTDQFNPAVSVLLKVNWRDVADGVNEQVVAAKTPFVPLLSFDGHESCCLLGVQTHFFELYCVQLK